MLRNKPSGESEEMHSATLVRSGNAGARQGFLSALCAACALLAGAGLANAAGVAGAAGGAGAAGAAGATLDR